MRLNRRKNRRSRDRRKRPLEDGRATEPEAPESDREERRERLARTVRSMHDDAEEGPAQRKRRRKRRARMAKETSRQKDALLRAARSVAADVLGVAREIMRWPARIWMAVAEALGAAILAVWRQAVLPALRFGWRWLRVALRWGERTATPARGLAVAALAATVALGASQFADYRAVEVGAPEYAQVENVAPAPQVARAMPSSPHGISV